MSALEAATEAATIAALEFEPACQSHSHGQERTPDGLTGHVGGEAVWIETGTCVVCGERMVRLVCDGRREQVLLALANEVTQRHGVDDGGCGYDSWARDWGFTHVAIGGRP